MKGYQQRLWKREDRTVGQKGKRLQEEDKEANVYGVRDMSSEGIKDSSEGSTGQGFEIAK